MKKILSLILIITMSMLLCSCDVATYIFESVTGPTYEELCEQAEEIYTNALEAVSKNDSASLFELYCNNNHTENLTEEISNLLSSIDGNIVSHGKKNEYNMPDHLSVNIDRFRMDEIVTDNGKSYTLIFFICVRINGKKADEDLAGLQRISLYESNAEKAICCAGECVESYDLQEVPKQYTEVDTNHILKAETQKEYVMNLIYYLNENDRESFVSMFCNEQKSVAEDKYSEIIELIDGSLETYSIVDSEAGGSYKYDHWERLSNDVTVYDLLSDSGNKYEIAIEGYIINETTPSEVGVSSFTISLVENKLNDELEHDVIREISF